MKVEHIYLITDLFHVFLFQSGQDIRQGQKQMVSFSSVFSFLPGYKLIYDKQHIFVCFILINKQSIRVHKLSAVWIGF